MNMQEITDRFEIADVLHRYSRGVDTRDWALWRSVFTDDATIDYTSTPFGKAGSRDEIADWLEESFAFVTVSQHFITNIEYDFDGDRAAVRAMFYNPMQFVGMSELSTCGGTYHHSMVRTGTGWKSERLVEESLWFVNVPGAEES
ncbi:nuclear transport factor 2 family protein [Gordonia aurantiaca]|uniref:nuclear transport factor 2 family protein n=1 Tax=Gordonia sp. B21 TaxID=3151852 RepID=UPI0032668211